MGRIAERSLPLDPSMSVPWSTPPRESGAQQGITSDSFDSRFCQSVADPKPPKLWVIERSAGRVRDDRLGSDLFAERSLFRILTEMPEVVVVHVIPVDDLDAPQILGVEDSLEAGRDYAHWKPLLRPQGLAVHAVGDQAVVHRFGDGHARGALHFLGAFSDEPCRAALQAVLLEQR